MKNTAEIAPATNQPASEKPILSAEEKVRFNDILDDIKHNAALDGDQELIAAVKKVKQAVK